MGEIDEFEVREMAGVSGVTATIGRSPTWAEAREREDEIGLSVDGHAMSMSIHAARRLARQLNRLAARIEGRNA